MKKMIQLIILAALSSFSMASEGHDHSATEAVHSDQEILNKVCPVMVGNKVDPELYSTYQDKRVHFCCPSCKEAFDENPEKYLDRLPQFEPASDLEHDEHGHSKASSFPFFRFVKPMGIVTLVLIILTVSAGLLRRKKPKLLLKWHKRLGIITLFTALIHALLVLLTH
ncbi:MAG: YHS domain-containing protein [Planctomycetota bacterium]|jgi:YHS domain-containing protein